MTMAVGVQLQVRAGVLSGNSPPSYGYGPFTKWKIVGQARASKWHRNDRGGVGDVLHVK